MAEETNPGDAETTAATAATAIRRAAICRWSIVDVAYGVNFRAISVPSDPCRDDACAAHLREGEACFAPALSVVIASKNRD